MDVETIDSFAGSIVCIRCALCPLSAGVFCKLMQLGCFAGEA